ncbi:unnamed protein product [marine sediment metagenome]|uniref:Uncharacterized protein n=1 Tax=marine sediment metagenome TaxID=412755 RepID=X1S6I7_9ZZZZ
MYWDVEISLQEEEKMIEKMAEEIHKRELDMFALITLETLKPLSYIGIQMMRFFTSPFLPAMGDDIGIGSEKVMQIFEKRENVEKLLTLLEKLGSEEEERKKEVKKTKKSDLNTNKSWWRKILQL